MENGNARDRRGVLRARRAESFDQPIDQPPDPVAA